MLLTRFFWFFSLCLVVIGINASDVVSEVWLKAPRFELKSPHKVLGSGGVWVQKEGMIMTGSEFVYDKASHYLTVNGSVRYTHPNGVELKSRFLAYDESRQLLRVSGDVTCRYGAIYATAGQAQYLIKTQQVILSDHPKAGRAGDEVVGQQIVIDLVTKRVSTVGAAKVKFSAQTLEKTP
jgi:lipopolysaccharide export system protein LptA